MNLRKSGRAPAGPEPSQELAPEPAPETNPVSAPAPEPEPEARDVELPSYPSRPAPEAETDDPVWEGLFGAWEGEDRGFDYHLEPEAAPAQELAPETALDTATETEADIATETEADTEADIATETEEELKADADFGWIEYPALREVFRELGPKKYKTMSAMKTAYAGLMELSGGDVGLARRIAERTI